MPSIAIQKCIRLAGLAVVFVSIPLTASGQVIAGTVVDPQGRLIVGAKVALTCDRCSETAKTNAWGEFAFLPHSRREGCTISVSAKGFGSFERTLKDEVTTLKIQLKLPRVDSVLSVSAHDQDPGSADGSNLGKASVSEAELRTISNNTTDLIAYAKQLAGITAGEDAIYVDGMPAHTLPPSEMIGRITVNADPFSAEYADGDQTHIEITTKLPERKLRFNIAGTSLGAGGQNALAQGTGHPISRGIDVSLSGPVPNFPLTFFLNANLAYNSTQQPIRAAVSQGQFLGQPGNPQTAATKALLTSALLRTSYSKGKAVKADISYYESKAASSNVGVGGLTLPEAGLSSTINSREVRATFSRSGASYTYRSGLVFNDVASHLAANADTLGVSVVGSFTAGGAAISAKSNHRVEWIWKNIIESSTIKHSWTTGIAISHASDSLDERPNPLGLMEFESLSAYQQALTGAPTGTWFLNRRLAAAQTSSLSVAPFIQSEVWRRKNATINAGLRADYRTGGRLLFSPRFSAAIQSRGFFFRAGAGMFVHQWSNDLMLHIREYDGLHFQRLLAPDVSFSQIQAPLPLSQQSIISQLSPDLTQPRNWMIKTSFERPLGRFIPGVEYTWIDGTHLLGSDRLRSASGWIDFLESNRSMRRHQLHVSNRLEWEKESLVFHYEWIHSRDNTAGPFSFPAVQNDLHTEWARSSGVSSHHVTLVAGFRTVGGISLNAVDSWRSSAPYNITTGLDPLHDGLYNDRGGLPRNSGNSPAFNSLNVYVYKRVPLPKFLWVSKRKTYAAIGVQGENLLGRRNYSKIDSVSNSPLFGQPLAAMAGRSFRLWSRFDRDDGAR